MFIKHHKNKTDTRSLRRHYEIFSQLDGSAILPLNDQLMTVQFSSQSEKPTYILKYRMGQKTAPFSFG